MEKPARDGDHPSPPPNPVPPTPAAPPNPAAPPSPPPPSRRPRDMVISLLVLLVPVVLFVGVYQALAGRNQPIEANPQPALAAAAAAGLAVAEPAALPAGWVPVSAVFQPGGAGGTLRIGYAVEAGGSAQLVQSTTPAEQLLPAELPEPATPAGTVQLAGRSWQAYPPRGAGGERALVLLAPEQTTIVRGTVSEAALRELATALGVR